MEEIKKFIKDQLSVWPLASGNFRSLKTAEIRHFQVGGIDVRAQYNPCRIASTTADVSEQAIAARPCFLCTENRPKEQFHIDFDGRKGRRYHVQVNPYPLFPEHLVIASDIHTPQSIYHYFVDMMDFARKYPQYLVFYNGPMSGASAPDHLHYQSCPLGDLPLQVAVDQYLSENPQPLSVQQDASIYHYPHFCRGVYALQAATPKSLAKLFYRLVDCAPMLQGEAEPRLNLFVYVHGGSYRCIVTLRGNLRSHHYFSHSEDHLTMTFGAADMAGMFVCPRKEDFDKLSARYIEEILDEVCIDPEQEALVDWRLTRTQPLLEVPILSSADICFEMISDGAGPQRVFFDQGRINYNSSLYDELLFDNRTRAKVFEEPSFILHMDRALTYAGGIKFVVENGTIKAINRIALENYVLSLAQNDINPEMPLEELTEAVLDLRRRIVEENFRARNYFGLTFAINPVFKKVIDLTWGKLKH